MKVKPEVMIPLTSGVKEMANQAAIVRRVAEEVFAKKEQKVEYLVGTMIELPAPRWRQTRSPRKPSSSASAPTT